MSDRPEAVVVHTVEGAHWTDADATRDAVAEAVPEFDVRLARTPPETRELLASAEVAVAASFPAELLDAAPSLRWVQALSAGVDHYDLDAFRERDVVVTNAAGVHAEPIAEQVVGYLLAFERNLLEGVRMQRRGVWERFGGGELRGKTLGIVGVGAIGTRIAEYGRAFGMEVIGTKRDPTEAPEAVDEVHAADDLYEVLPRADYLVVACPLTEETRGLLGADELAAMGEDAVLVNVARGPIVDEAALVEALQQGVLGGAALDVFEEEPLGESRLWDLSNVLLTPHMAGATPHKAGRVADVVAENYEAFAGDGEWVNRVA